MFNVYRLMKNDIYAATKLRYFSNLPCKKFEKFGNRLYICAPNMVRVKYNV